MNRFIVIALIASIVVLPVVVIKLVSADDLDTMGTFCAMALPNETIKAELVDNYIIGEKYSNVTCTQIGNLIKSGQVDIDCRQGFNGLIPYIDLKAEKIPRIHYLDLKT